MTSRPRDTEALIPQRGAFDVVYYPLIAISNPRTLAVLCLLCDRVWLPGVYLPTDEVPVEELHRVLSVAANHERDGLNRRALLALRDLIQPARVLRDVLTLTGKFGYMGLTDRESEPLARAVEEASFGPPEPGFTPMLEGGFAYGAGSRSINAPGPFAYPANAVVFALKHGLPLLTDDAHMPLPSIAEGEPAGPLAQLLAFALAIEAVDLVLPPIRAVHPETILEARYGLREELVPFRAAMFRLASDLRSALNSGFSPEAVRREAVFLVNTRVRPDLDVLRQRLEDKGGRWYSALLDFGLSLPQITHYFGSGPPDEAVTKTLGKVAEVVNSIRTRISTERKETRERGVAYLLNLERRLSR